MKKPPLLFLCCLISPLLGFGQHPLPTKSISVFKNGTAFVVRSGEVTPTNGHFRLNREWLPEALFGTVWLTSPDKSIGAVSTFIDSVSKETVATYHLISAKENIGKRATFHLKKDGQSVKGIIREVNENIVVVEASENWILFLGSDIERMEYDEKPKLTFTETKAERFMQVDFLSPKPKQTIDFMYMRNGLSWYPQYRIDLTGEDKATLSFRAELANDAEDIHDSEVNFVVGVPNFLFSSMLDPLFNFAPLGIRGGGGSTFDAYGSNLYQARAVMTQSFANTVAYDTEVGDPAGLPAAVDVDGESQEDLFFYTINGVTLPKGGRAMYTVFSREIEVEHIYESQLPPNTTNSSAYLTEPRTLPEPVLHRLKITNASTQPFTTGSAMVFRTENGKAKPISQDKINYTPAGGKTVLTMTNASDVEVRHKENETARVTNAKRENKLQYDLVTVAGEITIKNHKSTDIRLDVRRTLIGALKTTNPAWELSKRVNFNSSLNEITDVCWELKMKAGEELTIKYGYEIYVR